MSNAPTHRFRLLVALAVTACVGAGFAASSAAASPPVGSQYCMDGAQTFATWDSTSAGITDVIVTYFGGVITLGEKDPANIGRSAVQQYMDAFGTDARGAFGVDTTIANYAVHSITAGACPVTPEKKENGIFLCYSKDQVDPGVWPLSEARDLIGQGYWEPSAVGGTVTDGTNVGGYHLVCNPAGAQGVADGGYVGGDGGLVSNVPPDAIGYYKHLG